jgi:hypothetical protein
VNKEQNPCHRVLVAPAGFHGGCFGVSGTPPRKPLALQVARAKIYRQVVGRTHRRGSNRATLSALRRYFGTFSFTDGNLPQNDRNEINELCGVAALSCHRRRTRTVAPVFPEKCHLVLTHEFQGRPANRTIGQRYGLPVSSAFFHQEPNGHPVAYDL